MPTPPTPVITGPPSGSQHTGSVTFEWELPAAPVADTTAPVFANAVLAADGVTLTINLTETGSPPVLPAANPTGFTVQVAGQARTLGALNRTGNTQYQGALASPALQGQTVTVAYAAGGGAPVRDSAAAANAMASFGAQPVTNNSTQTAPSVTVIGTNFNDAGAVDAAAIPEATWDFIFDGTTTPDLVYADMGGADGMVGRLSTSGGTTGQGRGYVPAGAAIADGEILAQLDTTVGAFSEPWSGPGVYARVTGGSQSGTRNWVGAWLYRSSLNARRIRIGHAVNGAVAYSELSIGWPSGTVLNIRFRFQGADLSVKVWERGTAEPAAWTRTYTTTILNAGKAGIRGAEGRTASDVTANAIYGRYYYWGIHNGAGTVPVPA